MENTKKYFTEEEVQDFKNGSFQFPVAYYEGNDPKNVVEVTQVVGIGGMPNNNGIPTRIVMQKHHIDGTIISLEYMLISEQDITNRTNK
jgi:hypothetical protein